MAIVISLRSAPIPPWSRQGERFGAPLELVLRVTYTERQWPTGGEVLLRFVSLSLGVLNFSVLY
jgi:hypothetical protein